MQQTQTQTQTITIIDAIKLQKNIKSEYDARQKWLQEINNIKFLITSISIISSLLFKSSDIRYKILSGCWMLIGIVYWSLKTFEICGGGKMKVVKCTTDEGVEINLLKIINHRNQVDNNQADNNQPPSYEEIGNPENNIREEVNYTVEQPRDSYAKKTNCLFYILALAAQVGAYIAIFAGISNPITQIIIENANELEIASCIADLLIK